MSMLGGEKVTRHYSYLAVAHKTNGFTKQVRSIHSEQDAKRLRDSLNEMFDGGYVVKEVNVYTTFDEDGNWLKTERIEEILL